MKVSSPERDLLNSMETLVTKLESEPVTVNRLTLQLSLSRLLSELGYRLSGSETTSLRLRLMKLGSQSIAQKRRD